VNRRGATRTGSRDRDVWTAGLKPVPAMIRMAGLRFEAIRICLTGPRLPDRVSGMSMRIRRVRHYLAYALGALVLIGVGAGCMTDLTRGRDFGDPPICEIHAQVMAKQKVPVISGYDLYGPDWAQAVREQFPHSDSPRHWDGDLTVYGEHALDYVCPGCNEARDQWLIQNRPGVARARGLIK
jgi:hypothetical protein